MRSHVIALSFFTILGAFAPAAHAGLASIPLGSANLYDVSGTAGGNDVAGTAEVVIASGAVSGTFSFFGEVCHDGQRCHRWLSISATAVRPPKFALGGGNNAGFRIIDVAAVVVADGVAYPASLTASGGEIEADTLEDAVSDLVTVFSTGTNAKYATTGSDTFPGIVFDGSNVVDVAWSGGGADGDVLDFVGTLSFLPTIPQEFLPTIPQEFLPTIPNELTNLLVLEGSVRSRSVPQQDTQVRAYGKVESGSEQLFKVGTLASDVGGAYAMFPSSLGLRGDTLDTAASRFVRFHLVHVIGVLHQPQP